jgi:hypothetical protein
LYPAGATNLIRDMNEMIGSKNSGMSTDQSAQSLKRAAMYVRMSTDHQKGEIVTPAEIRAYRLLDNNLAENSKWDEKQLAIELTD